MRIPRTVRDFDKGNTGFHESAGQQAGLAKGRAAIEVFDFLRLFVEVEAGHLGAEDEACGLRVDFLMIADLLLAAMIGIIALQAVEEAESALETLLIG